MLNTLIVGRKEKVATLQNELTSFGNDLKVLNSVNNSHHAWGDIRDGKIDVIFINPFGFESNNNADLTQLREGIDDAVNFIFHVRFEFPMICFVLYTSARFWDTCRPYKRHFEQLLSLEDNCLKDGKKVYSL